MYFCYHDVRLVFLMVRLMFYTSVICYYMPASVPFVSLRHYLQLFVLFQVSVDLMDDHGYFKLQSTGNTKLIYPHPSVANNNGKYT